MYPQTKNTLFLSTCGTCTKTHSVYMHQKFSYMFQGSQCHVNYILWPYAIKTDINSIRKVIKEKCQNSKRCALLNNLSVKKEIIMEITK